MSFGRARFQALVVQRGPTVGTDGMIFRSVYIDGKDGLYRKVSLFPAPPAGFRSQLEANAVELDPTTLEEAGRK